MSNHNNIALGTWSWGKGVVGGDAIFGSGLDAAQLNEAFAAALEAGFTTFDTAYAYGAGASEEVLGQLIKQYPENKVVISDKFTPQMVSEDSENPVLDMLQGSLNRLDVDFIDIYWIHNSSDIERWTPLLAQAVASGHIGRIGVSNHSLAQVQRVQEILSGYDLKLSAVQNHFSLLYRRSLEDGLLEYCRENDIEFFSYMVLEQGALGGKYDAQNPLPADSARGARYNPLLPAMEPLLATLRQVAQAHEASVAQIAIAWALAQQTTPIIGLTNAAQVADLSQAQQVELSESELAQILASAEQIPVDVSGGWEGEA